MRTDKETRKILTYFTNIAYYANIYIYEMNYNIKEKFLYTIIILVNGLCFEII